MPLPCDTSASLSRMEFLKPLTMELAAWIDENEMCEWRQKTGSAAEVSDPTDPAWVPEYDSAAAFVPMGDIAAWWKRPKDAALPTPVGDIITIDADVVVMHPGVKIGDVFVRADGGVYQVERVTSVETDTHITCSVRRVQ